MATELYNDGTHRCVVFNDLAGDGDIQANQSLIIHQDRGMLIDPGGTRTFSKISAEMAKFLPPQKLDYIFISHQDPDVGSSVGGYLLITDAKVCFSAVWERFIPAFTAKGIASQRIITIPDAGMRFNLQGADLIAVPAHFLHSPGNFQLYDAVSKTLFTSDLGAAVMPTDNHEIKVADFNSHVQYMEEFHRRYMSSELACQWWAEMIRGLDIERIVPQHGLIFEGKAMVNQFIDWVAKLKCGIGAGVSKDIFKIPS
jgi:flavorubredoxin